MACCVYYHIKTVHLKKEPLTPCSALKSVPKKGEYIVDTCQNCTLYASPERPPICEDFKCQWLLGHGDEEDRPDKSHILVDCSKQIENAYEAKPLKEGAESTPEGREVIDRMSRSLGTPMIVLGHYELKIKRIVGRAVK